jgi:hypothetical protein
VVPSLIPYPEKELPGRPRDLSVDYLRTTLTLLVIALHSSLAYTTFAHFDAQHIFRSTTPVVDRMRWAFFDYAENFNDVFFMSLMFFVSGLFFYPALRRHGALKFIRDRVLRLGVPFAFTVVLLMPIAYYASWQLSGRSRGFADFYVRLAQGGFAYGPPWFVWILLFFDMVLVLLLLPVQQWMPGTERFMTRLREHPVATFLATFVLAALAYLPLRAHFGFAQWTDVYTLVFQTSRIGLYFLWFVFGFLVGAPNLESGLLSRTGSLARRWPLWMAACVVAYNAFWFVPKWSILRLLSSLNQHLVEALLWVLSCVASSFGFLALFRGIDLKPRPWMTSLSRSAYVMYLVHYVYVLWAQRLLLASPIHVGLKFAFVFLTATLLSWLTAQLVLRIPTLKSIL